MLFGVKFRQLMLQSRSEACRNMLRDHCGCKNSSKNRHGSGCLYQ
ncbi:MAG: hypothetical protein RLZZ436_2783 [Planctomycetota bacterium]